VPDLWGVSHPLLRMEEAGGTLGSGGAAAQSPPPAAVAQRHAHHVVEQLLSLAVLEPTLGARRLADRLTDAGWPLTRAP
jgi:hypothetical protein